MKTNKNRLLINLSNHPKDLWQPKQLEAATEFADTIIDIPFPAVDPHAGEAEIRALADEYIEKIARRKSEGYTPTVHIMGEMNLTYRIVSGLKEMGIECVASTTERTSTMVSATTKESVFNFVKFRRYAMSEEQTTATIKLTDSQEAAMKKLKAFIADDERPVFILTGYAGTGKTTLTKVLIKELVKRDIGFSLHASTGRAAKILSDATNTEATTVHSLLYTFCGLNQDLDNADIKDDEPMMDNTGQLLLQFGMAKPDRKPTDRGKHIYIIDEASMLSDVPDRNPTQAIFGTGRLLSDLFTFDKENGKFIFIGDNCQLPPVSGGQSPALAPEYLAQNFSMEAAGASLTEIMRQADGNDLIAAAARIRKYVVNPPQLFNGKWAKFPLRGFRNVTIHRSQIEMLCAYIENIKAGGFNSCTMISRSNRNCRMFSSQIRSSLQLHSPVLQPGDLLMVTQNNLVSGLMNGDMVTVRQIARREQRAGLSFLHVEVEGLANGKVFSQLLIENTLSSATGIGITQEQQKSLLIDFHKRMREKGIKQKSEMFEKNMREDIYLNALRTIYGYVITCHKAQGGEWDDVYIDIPRNLACTPSREDYQWLYTAITRAKTRLHIVDDFYLM